MRRFSLRLLFSTGLVGLAALAGCKPPSVADGAAVFHKNCAPCHRSARGIPLAPPLETYYAKQPAPSDRRTRIIIREGGNFMPPFGRRLTNQQINDVIAYLKMLPQQPAATTASSR
jgi:mono/diheme cytochrome c family protein